MPGYSGGDGSRSAAEPPAVLSLSSVLVLSYQLVGGAGGGGEGEEGC